MLPWVILIIFTFSLIVKSRLVFALSSLFLFFFSAIRYDVGFDYSTYWNMISNGSFEHYSSEIANYTLFTLSYLLDTPEIYFIITSFFIIFLFTIGIVKLSKDWCFSLLIFISIPIFYLNSLSIVRQFCAVSLIFYGFKCILNKQYVFFILIVLAASLFHPTAIVSLVCLLFVSKNFSNKFYFLFFFLVLALKQFFLYGLEVYFNYYYKYYIQNEVVGGGNAIAFLLLGIWFFCLVFRRNVKSEPCFEFLINTFTFGVILFLILIQYGHASRISLYFLTALIPLLPYYIEIFNPRKIARVVGFLVLFPLLIYSLYLGTLNPIKDPNIPYLFIFNR